jgi:hypothetical protein
MQEPERKLFDAMQEYLKDTVPQIAQFMGEQGIFGSSGSSDFLSSFVSNLAGGGSKPTPVNETAKERYEAAKTAYGEAMLHDVAIPQRTNKLLESIASSLLILVERGLR